MGRVCVVPEKAHPFVILLFKGMVEQKVALRDMAYKSGVSESALTDWRYRTTPNVINLGACLQVVGMKLIAVPLDFDETTINQKEPGS